MSTIPTYNIGDIIQTRGSLAGLTGRVIFYDPPDDDLEDHGGLCFIVLTVEPGCYWDQGSGTKVGTEEDMCIYHPDSEWYDKCGGGKEPVVITETDEPNNPETRS
jgi:hypothetical protein